MAHKRLKIIVDNMPDMIVMRRFADDNIYCVSKKEHSRVLTNERIAHGLALVDAYIRILDFSRENAPKLEFFRAEYKLLNGCIPDMVLAFRRGDDSRRILYVEYDRGTKTIVSQRKKVDSYKRYFEDRQYLDEEFQPGDVKPRIVFLCESPFRVKNITQAIPGVCACDNVPALFLF
jgi:hypothetical protein